MALVAAAVIVAEPAPGSVHARETPTFTASWSSNSLVENGSTTLTILNTNTNSNGSRTSYPSGLWSDGETLWVVDDLAKRVYAYTVPDFVSLGGGTP